MSRVGGLRPPTLVRYTTSMTTPINPILNPMITVAAIAGITLLLVSQKTLFIPMALGLLFAFFILRSTMRLEQRGVPRIIANLIMIILSIGLCVGVGMLFSFAISQFAQNIPEHIPQIQSNIANLEKIITATTGVPVDVQQEWVAENINLLSLGAKNISTIATSIGKIVTTTSLTFIYAFFILYYRDKLMSFFKKLFGVSDSAAVTHTLNKLIHLVPNYLSGVVRVMGILAVVNTLGFWAIGVPSPVFFGILAAILNVIPYAGPIIGFAIVILFSLATAGPGVAIAATIMFIVIQFLENNILTPNIAGGTININPLAAIVGILIGHAMWGVVGMVVALPFIGMLKIICDANPSWEAFGYLIGDAGTEQHALSWANIKKTFTRKKTTI